MKPTARQTVAARCLALLGRSTVLREAARLLVVRSKGERSEARNLVAEVKPLLGPPRPEESP